MKWLPHPHDSNARQCIKEFDNGYEASILKGGRFYTRNGTYEIAIMHPDEGICYDTGLTEDVFGYLNEDQVIKTLKDISELPTRKKHKENKDDR